MVEKILTLGDGDFSFSKSLISILSAHKIPFDLISTGFDSYDDLLYKYSDASGILEAIRSSNVRILHGINATRDLSTLGDFNHIIFNFPHLGKEDCRLHASLIAHIMHSALPAMKRLNAVLYLTLTELQAELWRIMDAANHLGLFLTTALPFRPENWPQYTRRRHQSGKSFSSRVERCFHYCFQIIGSSSSHNILITLEEKSASKYNHMTTQTNGLIEIGVDTDNKSIRLSSDNDDALLLYTGTDAARLDIRSYQCVHCNRAFKTRQGVRTHIHMVHILSTTTRTDNDTNRSSSARDEEIPTDCTSPQARGRSCYDCSVCSRIFSSTEALMQHKKSKHYESSVSAAKLLDEDPERCSAGSASFTDSDVIPDTSTSSNSRFCCPICCLTFRDEAQVQMHMEGEPTLRPASRLPLEKQLLCRICDRRFSEQRALSQHLKFCEMK